MKQVFIGFCLAQLGAIFLSLWANLGVVFGLHPESSLILDWFTPCASLILAAWWSGRASKNWRFGGYVALFCVGFWVLVHFYLTARFSLAFASDGLTQLRQEHFAWWFTALILGALAGFWGARFSSARMGVGLGTGILLAIWMVQSFWSFDSFNDLEPTDWSDGGPSLGNSREVGVAETFFPHSDGTTIHLLRFDLRRIRLGLYDADSDDSHAFDDRNATWLGQTLRRVNQKIAARDGKAPLCIVNGGFFGNIKPWIGTHEAPLLENGKARYNSRFLQNDWPQQAATLVWKSQNGVLKPRIEREIEFDALSQWDGALGGLRVLREAGKDATLAPGMGGSTLKCSRTSVAFDDDNLWILSVRDPDGEASSVRANQWEKSHPSAPKIQVGGWDVAQVQKFWREREMPNVVLFDGGESTQIGVDYGDRFRVVHSSFHFSRTLGFLKQKPLRLVLPMLPPSQANGGVLNWFYVSEN
jgi:hypothetical protein